MADRYKKYKRKKERRRKEGEEKLTAGKIKDELAEKYRKTGSLGKKEKLSMENASKIMKGAKQTIKKNRSLPKSEVIERTQEKLRENKQIDKSKQKKKLKNRTADKFVENWKKQGLIKEEPAKEAVERIERFADEAYAEVKKHKLPADIKEEDIEERVKEKAEKWKKEH